MKTDKPKRGRPPKDASKKQSYHLQRTLLGKEAKEKLTYYSDKTGLSASDIIRLSLQAYFRKMDKKNL
jgi:hypothetical protein